MVYTKDDPPAYIKPLLEEYEGVKVESCGYERGDWVKLSLEDDTVVKFNRDSGISVSIDPLRKQVEIFGVEYDNVLERDENIGEILIQELGGSSSLAEALDEL